MRGRVVLVRVQAAEASHTLRQSGSLVTAFLGTVEMARRLLGENWMAEYVAKANAGGIERVLV